MAEARTMKRGEIEETLVSDVGHTETTQPLWETVSQVPIGGWLEHIELWPLADYGDGEGLLTEFLANMDERVPYSLTAVLRDAGGGEIPLEVRVVWRELKDYREAV